MELWSGPQLYHIQLVSIFFLSTFSNSITSYASTDLQLSKSTIGTSDNFNVTVTVHNTGSVDGKEVVQVSRWLP